MKSRFFSENSGARQTCQVLLFLGSRGLLLPSGPQGISLLLCTAGLFSFRTGLDHKSCVQSTEFQHQSTLAMKYSKLRYHWGCER